MERDRTAQRPGAGMTGSMKQRRDGRDVGMARWSREGIAPVKCKADAAGTLSGRLAACLAPTVAACGFRCKSAGPPENVSSVDE